MIQVREYATLTTEQGQNGGLDRGGISPATLDWMLELQQRWQGATSPFTGQGKQHIKLGSYVGFLQSPDGEGIEILPKTQHMPPSEREIEPLRALLRKMLLTAMQLKPRQADAASLQRMRLPLNEWILAQFLDELAALVKRGLRFDYQRTEEESRFIRGQLNLARQCRQPVARSTWFHISHDIYSPQRVENRLLKTALTYVLKVTKDANNWRLANELAHQLAEIEPLQQPLRELSNWQSDKLMVAYEHIKPWTVLILEKLNPNFQSGFHRGIALLFPMEMLFESHVSHHLQRILGNGVGFTPQAGSQFLIRHQPDGSADKQSWFQLKPDVVLSKAGRCAALDCKWKLLDEHKSTSLDKYGIKQADLYQLYAYGHKYMQGSGDMMLIYPKHTGFSMPLPVFSYDDQLHLWAVPFDLQTDSLVAGDWHTAFDGWLCTDAHNSASGSTG